MRVAVIGAGLAVLRAAALLGERGATVEVFEASDRLGGRLCTARPHPGIAYEAGGEWIDHDHFLRETRGGGVHDKRIAEGTPSPFPAGEPVVAGSGLSGGTLLQVEILKPTKTPRGQELTVDEKGANQALCHRRRRIEHVHSSGKRYRIVKDRMHLWQLGVCDLVMKLCCAWQHFRVRLTP